MRRLYFLFMCLVTSFSVQAGDPDKISLRHIITIPYQLPVHETGRTSLVFPISIQRAPTDRSYFFAYQFQFMSGNVGYIGARPWMGVQQIALAFSVFGKGVKVMNKTLCRAGTGKGPGVTCSKIVRYQSGKKYFLSVVRDKMNRSRWRGFFSDDSKQWHILMGEWEVNPLWGNLLEKQTAFIQYFKKIASCQSLPMTDVTFYPPLDGTFDQPDMKIKQQCAHHHGIPPITEDLKQDAYRFMINQH